jgi:hypothetical protein
VKGRVDVSNSKAKWAAKCEDFVLEEITRVERARRFVFPSPLADRASP